MFKYLKNDKITKLVGKAKSSIYKQLNNHEINFLEAHLKMENEIKIIYDNNDFSYQELLKRKERLTAITENITNISISLFFGFIASIIFEFIKLTMSIHFDGNNKNIFTIILLFISIVLLFCVISFILFYTILKCAYEFSSNDKFNTKDNELKLIDKKLSEYEAVRNNNIN